MMNTFDDLQNGVVLAELGGHGDGAYCANYGAGAALVVMGTYIVDAGDDVPYPAHFVFEPGTEKTYAEYLRDQVAAARGSGARVGVSIISVELKDSVDFLETAQEAGVDYVSLCAYSAMHDVHEQGAGNAVVSAA